MTPKPLLNELRRNDEDYLMDILDIGEVYEKVFKDLKLPDSVDDLLSGKYNAKFFYTLAVKNKQSFHADGRRSFLSGYNDIIEKLKPHI